MKGVANFLSLSSLISLRSSTRSQRENHLPKPLSLATHLFTRAHWSALSSTRPLLGLLCFCFLLSRLLPLCFSAHTSTLSQPSSVIYIIRLCLLLLAPITRREVLPSSTIRHDEGLFEPASSSNSLSPRTATSSHLRTSFLLQRFFSEGLYSSAHHVSMNRRKKERRDERETVATLLELTSSSLPLPPSLPPPILFPSLKGPNPPP